MIKVAGNINQLNQIISMLNAYSIYKFKLDFNFSNSIIISGNLIQINCFAFCIYLKVFKKEYFSEIEVESHLKDLINSAFKEGYIK